MEKQIIKILESIEKHKTIFYRPPASIVMDINSYIELCFECIGQAGKVLNTVNRVDETDILVMSGAMPFIPVYSTFNVTPASHGVFMRATDLETAIGILLEAKQLKLERVA